MITCEVSYYPLGSADVYAVVDETLEIIKSSGLHHEIGRMSTLISGETSEVFALLQRIAETAEDAGHHFVLRMAVSNACNW